MRIRILGAFHVEDGGQRITIDGVRQRAVLADLVLHANEVVPSEQILVDLWGEDTPPSAANAQWPGNGAGDRYTGPWNRPAAHTILLLGNTGDAVLPYKDDLAMAHDLARARLLTVRGYGHTELANPSTCATNYELSYLQTGALPPAGTVCKEDAAPFPAPHTPAPARST